MKALHNYIFILADLLYMYTRNFTFSFKNGFLQVQFPSPPHPVLEARQSLELCRPWFFFLSACFLLNPDKEFLQEPLFFSFACSVLRVLLIFIGKCNQLYEISCLYIQNPRLMNSENCDKRTRLDALQFTSYPFSPIFFFVMLHSFPGIWCCCVITLISEIKKNEERIMAEQFRFELFRRSHFQIE